VLLAGPGRAGQVLLMDEPLANLDPPHQTDWMLPCAPGGAGHHGGQRAARAVVCLAGRRDGGDGGRAGGAPRRLPGPDTHAALEAVFDHRIRICQVEDLWMALPR
jgi:iron complex transport system ATP-binding protein